MVSDLLQVKLEMTLGTFSLDVDFTVNAKLTVLFGPSGCGKTSILNCLAGLRKPASGSIVVSGKTFFDARRGVNLPPQLRQIGYVFQNQALFPHLTVAENIGFGIDKWDKEKRQSRIFHMLEFLRLEGLAQRRINEISGGQVQRVALARALAPEPKMLLLDEPFSALDAELRHELVNELQSMQKMLRLPMVVVTHSRAEALQLADTVVILERGRVVEVGDPQRLLGNPESAVVSPKCKFSW